MDGTSLCREREAYSLLTAWTLRYRKNMTGAQGAQDTVAVPPAPGAERYLALDLANSAVALTGGQVLDLLATPAAANAWLHERGLAPVDAGMQEQCAEQLRAMREHLRALIAATVEGSPRQSRRSGRSTTP